MTADVRCFIVRDVDAFDMIRLEDIDRDLSRFFLIRLAFPADMEARYEVDTGRGRAFHINLVAGTGLFFYTTSALLDSAIYPDLGRGPFLTRLMIIPFILVSLWFLPRASATARSAYTCLMVAIAAVSMIGFMTESRGPLAPYTIILIFLMSVFGNVMLRLPFLWACLLTSLIACCIGGMLLFRTDMPTPLIDFLWLNTAITVFYGAIISNQLERIERRSYLLALRESVRSAELSRDKEKLSTLTLEDPLTGVANRRAFDAALTDLVRQVKSGAPPFSMLMIDVDHFKPFNDHYGHLAGDACLQLVADVLKDVVIRKQDLLARYGGEEFAVLLSACGPADAEAVAQKIRRAIAAAAIPHDHQNGRDRTLSISIGVASFEGSTATAMDILVNADRNLYAAKRAGRNRVVAGNAA